MGLCQFIEYCLDVTGGTRAQTVSQPEDQVTIHERDPLELRCTASYTGSPTFYWYVQYPKQSLEMLLKYLSGNTLVRGSKGFEAEFNKTNKSFNLRKSSVEVSDVAVYFCAVNDTVT
uniref:Ig-like domain-containing protein n=1 Tax=Vombatus ursinus TaxID=29139 RepID=A0A4X2LMX9_VOMUR